MRLHAAGDNSVLVELDDNSEVHTLTLAVRERWGEELAEVVPGHRSLLVVFRRSPPPDFRSALARINPRAVALEPATVTLPVRYDGVDLEAVAAAVGVAPAEVAAIHSATTYRAAFMGFAPGFAYLLGGDPRLALPRREEPRARVESGSVAIAAGYSAVYPSSAPGGWHIIGHTDVRLFDLGHRPPTLITPGTRVTFEAL